ncbi:uroporphyrinogen-III synthase [Thermomonas flagellata]|uniref:uroporphyrinogen-III synthase n=1 Tax=Thermomonas flagellata TaxID=2888524 RepID=UPI001F038F21|nr:uroporphyrinogen-III synthase [Thermomonas flagellata]
MPATAPPPPAARWTVLSLRPAGQHAGLRRAAARAGGRLLALSPLAIVPAGEAAVRAALAQALACPRVVVTSANAVAAAAALAPLRARRGQVWLAVGSSTRRALARIGIPALAPQRMDSEGLLALPALQDVAGLHIGLLTGRGGRDRLLPALRARGAIPVRADLYARQPRMIPARRWQALRAAWVPPVPLWLALSSAEALQAWQAQLPPDLAARLPQLPVVAASARLAEVARAAGFTRLAVAAAPTPPALVQAALPLLGMAADGTPTMPR